MKNEVIVDIHVSAEETLRVYEGSARFIYAHALDGRSVKFPVNIMKKFVSLDGIQGRFVIEFDTDKKFKDIRRL
jgi:hypothetical protein